MENRRRCDSLIGHNGAQCPRALEIIPVIDHYNIVSAKKEGARVTLGKHRSRGIVEVLVGSRRRCGSLTIRNGAQCHHVPGKVPVRKEFR